MATVNNLGIKKRKRNDNTPLDNEFSDLVLVAGSYASPALRFSQNGTSGIYNFNDYLGIAGLLVVDTFPGSNDGSYTNNLSICSKDDVDTGINFVNGGGGILEIISQNLRTARFTSVLFDFYKRIRMSYTDGTANNAQLSFARSAADYRFNMYFDPNDDFHLYNSTSSANIELNNATGGVVIVQPQTAATTDVDFQINVGNGSTFDNLLSVTETGCFSATDVHILNGNDLLLQNTTAGYDGVITMDASDNLELRNDETGTGIMLRTPNNGYVTVRPSAATLTNTSFTVDVGDGSTSFDTLFSVDESAIQGNVVLTNRRSQNVEWTSATPSVTSTAIGDGTNFFTGITGNCHVYRTNHVAGASDFVHAFLEVSWTGKGSASGTIIIELGTTLPSNNIGWGTPWCIGRTTGVQSSSAESVVAEMADGDNQIILYHNKNNGSASTALDDSHYLTAGTIKMHSTYILSKRVT